MGAEWLREKAAAAKEKLYGHHQRRCQGHEHNLGIKIEEPTTDQAGWRQRVA